MSVDITWAGLGVVLAILIHGAASVWWASKITNQIGHLNMNLVRLDKELEKRDTQISAAWRRIDDINNRVTKIEAKHGI